MKRLAYSTAILLGFSLIALDRSSKFGDVAAAGVDEHAYFDSLTRRADVWRSYSLRDFAQLRNRNAGGFVEGNDTRWTTYNPENDSDRHRQDATKVTIPTFFETVRLTQPVGAADTVLTLADAYKPQYGVGRIIKVDREVMTVTKWLSDTTISVQRGTHASSPAPHQADAILMHATNSLKSQMRLPLNTEDGHTYFVTWDAYWTDSFVGAGDFNHKAFQFSSGSQDGDAIFLEPDATYNAVKSSCYDPRVHIGAFSARGYNKLGGVTNWLLTDGDRLGPGILKQQPLPQLTAFCFKPNQWVRFFMQIRQRANDYDYVDMWVADEERDPVQLLSNVAVSVRPTGKTPNSIQKFWLEFNTSDDIYYRYDNRNLVAYVRNFVALRDNADPRSLLVRPVPGAQAASGPAAPRNVRIIQGS